MLADDYPVQTICEVLDYPRSTYYYRSSARDDAELQAALLELAGQWPTYGYRRVTAQLKRAGWHVNKKRIHRLMQEMGLLSARPRRRVRTTNSEHTYQRYPNRVQGLEVQRPEQVWVADITYVRLQNDFVYLAVLMDVYTRYIRGWHLSHSLDQSLTLYALEQALAHGRPEIHHSDQGVQYAAIAYVNRLRDVGIQISMADVGEAWQNGHAERLIRTIKEEEIDLSDYQDFQNAYQQIAHFLNDVYNRKRIHSALGYLTPSEFEVAFQEKERQTHGFVH